MDVLGLPCCPRAFSSCVKWGILSVVVWRILITVASVVCSMGSPCVGFSSCSTLAKWLQFVESRVVAHELSCSTCCGIFLDQGSNPCSLHCRTDSHPLYHQESPKWLILKINLLVLQERIFKITQPFPSKSLFTFQECKFDRNKIFHPQIAKHE